MVLPFRVSFVDRIERPGCRTQRFGPNPEEGVQQESPFRSADRTVKVRNDNRFVSITSQSIERELN